MFGTSKEKDTCKKSCPQPCEHTEYQTSLSNAGLQRNVFIKKLTSSPNETVDFPLYENFLKMSDSEKKEYIEWVCEVTQGPLNDSEFDSVDCDTNY